MGWTHKAAAAVCCIALAACSVGGERTATVSSFPDGQSVRTLGDSLTIAVTTDDDTDADLILHVPAGQLSCRDPELSALDSIRPGQQVTYERLNDDVMESDPPGIDARELVVDCSTE